MDPRASQDCVFFLRGYCSKGALCPYKHDLAKRPLSAGSSGSGSGHGHGHEQPDCIFYLRGFCAKGALCPYKHDPVRSRQRKRKEEKKRIKARSEVFLVVVAAFSHRRRPFAPPPRLFLSVPFHPRSRVLSRFSLCRPSSLRRKQRKQRRRRSGPSARRRPPPRRCAARRPSRGPRRPLPRAAAAAAARAPSPCAGLERPLRLRPLRPLPRLLRQLPRRRPPCRLCRRGWREGWVGGTPGARAVGAFPPRSTGGSGPVGGGAGGKGHWRASVGSRRRIGLPDGGGGDPTAAGPGRPPRGSSRERLRGRSQSRGRGARPVFGVCRGFGGFARVFVGLPGRVRRLSLADPVALCGRVASPGNAPGAGTQRPAPGRLWCGRRPGRLRRLHRRRRRQPPLPPRPERRRTRHGYGSRRGAGHGPRHGPRQGPGHGPRHGHGHGHEHGHGHGARRCVRLVAVWAGARRLSPRLFARVFARSRARLLFRAPFFRTRFRQGRLWRVAALFAAWLGGLARGDRWRLFGGVPVRGSGAKGRSGGAPAKVARGDSARQASQGSEPGPRPRRVGRHGPRRGREPARRSERQRRAKTDRPAVRGARRSRGKETQGRRRGRSRRCGGNKGGGRGRGGGKGRNRSSRGRPCRCRCCRGRAGLDGPGLF